MFLLCICLPQVKGYTQGMSVLLRENVTGAKSKELKVLSKTMAQKGLFFPTMMIIIYMKWHTEKP